MQAGNHVHPTEGGWAAREANRVAAIAIFSARGCSSSGEPACTAEHIYAVLVCIMYVCTLHVHENRVEQLEVLQSTYCTVEERESCPAPR